MAIVATTAPSTVETTPPTTESPTTPIPDPMMSMEENVTLTDVNFYEGCTTSVEVQCTVDPGPGTGTNEFRVCFTEFVTISRPGVSDY